MIKHLIYKTALALVSLSLLSACGAGGSDKETSSYSIQLTSVNLTRVGDDESMNVDSLPIQGATLEITE